MTSNGLYIHIPFCVSKCVYCDFVSFPSAENYFESYVDALALEMSLRSASVKDKIFDTVYIGGGTPGILPSFLFSSIFAAMRENFNIDKGAEITVEVNPSDADSEKCGLFKRLGVNRVSMGLQSVNESTLKIWGRRHTVADFVKSVKMFQSAGITNLSGDIMLGTPGQSTEEIKEAAGFLCDLGLKHASAYALKVESGTPLKKMVSSGKIKLPDDDITADFYDLLVKEFSAGGCNRYEGSNFCNGGFHSRHNLNCWMCREYLGLGLNSHSYMFGRRFSNVKNIENYIAKVNNGMLPVSQSRRIDDAEKIKERIMLGSRLETGFSYRLLDAEFNIDYLSLCAGIKRLVNSNLIEIADGFVKIRPDKFYMMNAIIPDLFPF